MAPAQNTQLEHVISEALKTGNVQALDVFLQSEIYEETPMKCTQQFLTKLDKLINRGLVQKNPKLASLGLASLHKCGKNLKLPGGRQGLPGLIAQGLIKKMVEWFGKCRHLWIQCGPQWSEKLIDLSEDFLNVLMVVHEACKEGTYRISESFLYPVGQLAVDPRIYVLIQKEAIRKFNLLLDKIPEALKKDRKILTSQEASDIMVKLAGQILEAGDYDFQSSLMEALCRMATPDERKALADKWFRMGHVASAFAQIRDSEFETACRKFLNMVNGMQGDKRRVFSYPCLEVYLDSYELLMPLDEKLEEFWIDFNLRSHSISFYFSLADEEVQDSHWETICINEHEVQSYNVREESKRQVLQIKLSEVVIVGAVEGSSLTIHFSSSLDILQAARNVYGHNQNRGSTVVKAPVKTLMEENSSQVVPESQLSLGESEKNTAPSILPAPAAPAQMVTPAKMKISESTTFISSSGGGSVRHSYSLPSNTPARGTGAEKPSMKVSAASKQAIKNKAHKHEKNIPLAEAVNMALAEQGDEQSQEDNFVPGTQPRTGRNMSTNWHRLSVSEMLTMPTQKMSSLPRSEPCSTLAGPQESCLSSRVSVSASSLFCQKQLHIQLTERLQQVLDERNQDSAPAPEITDIRRDSNDTSAEDQYVSSLCTSKLQQAQSNGHAKGKSKVQTSLAVGAIPIKTSVKTSSTNTQKKEISPKAEAENMRAASSKEKRDSEVTGSMVKLISSHYKVNGHANKKDTAENITPSWIPPPVNRPVFNMSWLATGKRETSRNLIKTYSKTTSNSVRQRKDIFTFSTSTPPSNGKEKRNTSAMQSSDINSSVLSTTKKEHPVEKKKRYVKKHLFSDTDTDNAMTEVSWLRESARRSKPKVTKYSRQAPIKPRAVPQHVESPDLLPPLPKAVMDNNKPTKKNSHMKKALGQPKETVKPAAAPGRPHAAGRRPKRAAAASAKSYKEPDTDDSQSEEAEDPPATKYSSTDHLKKTEEGHEAQKKKKTNSTQEMKNRMKPGSESLLEKPATSKKYSVGQQGKQDKTCSVVPEVKTGKNTSELSTGSYRRKHSNNQSDFRKPSVLTQKPENVLQETSKLNKKNAQEQMSSLRDSWTTCQTSFCPSPPFIEKMRFADRSAPTLDLTYSPLLTPRGSLLPASPKPPCQDSPSPILLLPKPRSTVSSKEISKSSLYSAEKNHGSSKTPSITSLGGQTPAPSHPAELSAAKISTIQQHLSSATHSPLSTLPLLTSTLLELDKPPLPSPAQSPLLNDSISHGYHCSLSKVSSVSQISPNQASTNSSVLTSKVKESPTDALVVSLKTEKTPLSDSKLAQSHVSGPSRKRHISLSSNSDDEEEEERKRSKIRGKRSPHMKPRKLFKSFEASEDELSQVKSSSHHWEAEVTDGEMDMDEDLDLPEIDVNPSNLCQQLSSELQKKFQKHYSMMELYNKQSLKTIQQHVTSINTQITKCRVQRLEQVQKVLLDEIHKLEQDDTVLESMEKDLTAYRKKQMTRFHSYQKQEIRRNETLKGVLQSSACHSLEYEDRIFTSEMCVIKKDMKSVQDKFLSEMLEGELQGVKRGLHALFFP